jgi:hypothetical protein
MFDSKAKLEAMTFDSIGAMIRAYADEAVLVARKQHGITLNDLSASPPASAAANTVANAAANIATLERLLDGQAAVDLEFQSRLWGSYFGELLRLRWGGAWLLAPYPGTIESAVPTLEIAGSRLWPTMKVHRRLTLGSSESLTTFYRLVEQRLANLPDQRLTADPPARPN